MPSVSLCQIKLAVYLIAASVLFPASATLAKKIDGDRFFDSNRLAEIRIEIPAEDWAKLCGQSRNFLLAFSGLPHENPYTYFKGDVWIDGLKIESVGIRKKGFFGSADFVRPSLKIKFNEYEDQDPVKGLSRLTLNNNKQDRSQLSQYLTYRLFRDAGNPAPRSGWAHVTVNGESLGIYSNVESIKKPFLSRSFGDKSGNLYEGTLSDVHPKALANLEVKTNEDANDLSDVRAIADLIAKQGDLDVEALEQLVDIDSLLRHWALEGLIGFWDGYSSNQNNYYVYFNPKNKGLAQLIPWGADSAFVSRSPFSRARPGEQAPTVIYAQSMLCNRLYHSDGIPERYRSTMQQILESTWDEKELLAEIDLAEKLVVPHLHGAQAGAKQAMDELRRFVRGRREVVNKALESWQPNVPQEPRTPAHVVEVGTAKGTFTTSFTERDNSSEDSGTAELEIQIGGDKLAFDKVTASAQPFQFPGLSPTRSRPTEGTAPATPPAPVTLAFSGTRADEEPINVALIIDRNQFTNANTDPIRATGFYRVGPFRFGGVNRTVVGQLRLSEAGVNPGDKVAGSFDLRVVETKGGFFQQFRNRGQPSPARQSTGTSTTRPSRSITLQQALDKDGDGTISSDEIEKASAVLRGLDRNRDGKLTSEELKSSG